ncbi:hypothetical protein [Altericroceibacterium xinjiangense]|uniref:hypothetical protein n=1 Tax=Altericroceibacterium xinjiangense TaxID=762261 RepID=UPI000F7DF2C6|nr:hypothetical protein [Altericroceibacterium xinjiangense]
MILESLWRSLETSAVGEFVATNSWAFPTLETLHVIFLVTVVGTVAIMDLRLLGLASNQTAVTEMSRDTLPWTWVGFVGAAITGGLLFVSKSTTYVINPYFQIKMILLVLAGLNMAIFHVFTWRTVSTWDSETAVPLGGKIAGLLSLIFWVLVVFFGRAIGFTLGMFYV